MERLFKYIAIKLEPISRPIFLGCVLLFVLLMFDGIKNSGFNVIFPLTLLMLWLGWASIIIFTFKERTDINDYPNITKKSYFDESSDFGKAYRILFFSFYLILLIIFSVQYAANI